MSTPAPTILFFDLDGTLMRNPLETGMFPEVVRRLGGEMTGAEATVFHSEIIAEYHARRTRNTLAPERQMDWDDIVASVARRRGVEWRGSLTELVAEYCVAPHIEELDRAGEVLDVLARAGHRRFVVSTLGLSRYQFPVLRALGLFGRFEDFLTPDRTGYLKNDPRFYGRYADSPPHALRISIGDRYVDDVVNPKSLGFRSILKFPQCNGESVLPWERPAQLPACAHLLAGREERPVTVLPDAVIRSLDELPGTIAHFEALRARDGV